MRRRRNGRGRATVRAGNLVRRAPRRLAEERVEPLVETPALRLERIVSTGQSTPAGRWYDQARDEWVVLLSGSARLRIEGERRGRALRPGDYLLLPARCRHRVDATDPAEPTVWLALHFVGDAARGGRAGHGRTGRRGAVTPVQRRERGARRAGRPRPAARARR